MLNINVNFSIHIFLVTNYLGVQCGSVNCHTHARCIDPNQAFCQCLPGYRGDGVSHCESGKIYFNNNVIYS